MRVRIRKNKSAVHRDYLARLATRIARQARVRSRVHHAGTHHITHGKSRGLAYFAVIGAARSQRGLCLRCRCSLFFGRHRGHQQLRLLHFLLGHHAARVQHIGQGAGPNFVIRHTQVHMRR